MKILLLIAVGLLGLALVSCLLGWRRRDDGDDAWLDSSSAESDPEKG